MKLTFAGVNPPAVKKFNGRVVQKHLGDEGVSILARKIVTPAFAQIAAHAAHHLEGGVFVDSDAWSNLDETQSHIDQACVEH